MLHACGWLQFPSAALELTLEARNPAAGWLQTAVVFYCEFSSERAPRLFRHIRNADRKRHLGTYPQLDVPHMCVGLTLLAKIQITSPN